jgi:hypothetical protein
VREVLLASLSPARRRLLRQRLDHPGSIPAERATSVVKG